MLTSHQKKLLTITILIILSFACSAIPLSAGSPTATTLPSAATNELAPASAATSTATYAIPIFEPTDTLAATEIVPPQETVTNIPPTKKVKNPSASGTADPNQVCPNAQPTRLKLNGFAFLTYDPPIPNRVRIGPGLGFDAKGLVKPGQVMQVIGGPICSGESVWWKIVVKYTELTGWVAEADSEQYWIEPCPKEGHCPPLTP